MLAVRLRFTPTRVGKTPLSTLLQNGYTVHPHAGGENAWGPCSKKPMCGSPPRGWGKRHGMIHDGPGDRFTPTRVGKTLEIDPDWFAGNGSPPRGWGKRQPCRPPRPRARFTPTRVGKTDTAAESAPMYAVHPHAGGENSPHPRTGQPAAVHPHAGGENCDQAGQGFQLFGSPPRGWGKR